MKFAIGYQLPEEKDEVSVLDIIDEFGEHISEIYFPWADMPSGRAPILSRRGYVFWEGQQRMESELRQIKEKGIKLDLLLNANCYGRYAVSEYLQNQVVSVLDHLRNIVGCIDIVTTASLTVAHVVKENFPEIDVRASVNMRIGNITAMEYISNLFDSYYLQREYNRDIEYVKTVKKWAKNNGKDIFLLVNSGCLNFCPAQTYHDNMVAHEKEIAETVNIKDWIPQLCWNYYRDASHWHTILQGSWVRPEDLHNYEGIVQTVKLATRTHANPVRVVSAYVNGHYRGNLVDLFEPGFSPVLQPYIIDNEKFPEDWFEKTSSCKRNCWECTYCKKVLEKVMVRVQ
jgi:collagenase-like PrtC family protease